MRDLETLDREIRLLLSRESDPESFTYRKLANIFDVSEDTIKRRFANFRRDRISIPGDSRAFVVGESETQKESMDEALRRQIRDYVIRSDRIYTTAELADHFDVAPKVIREVINDANSDHYQAQLNEENDTVAGGKAVDSRRQRFLVNQHLDGEVIRFGLISDEHICSHFSCVTELEAAYDIFEERGIDTVLSCGNYIDGCNKNNRSEVTHHTLKQQVDEFIRLMPQREGITTYSIAGDDHEGWFQQDTGIEVGAYTQSKMEEAGRQDWKYLDYFSYDFIFKNTHGGLTNVRLMHPGGGSSYAYSYRPQKIVEATPPHERPDMLLIGHYHKSSYNVISGVHVFQAGCFQAQSTFMKKKSLAAHVGCWIIEARVNPAGRILSVVSEWISMDPQLSPERISLEDKGTFLNA